MVKRVPYVGVILGTGGFGSSVGDNVGLEFFGEEAEEFFVEGVVAGLHFHLVGTFVKALRVRKKRCKGGRECCGEGRREGGRDGGQAVGAGPSEM
jgi:hypothetical protein